MVLKVSSKRSVAFVGAASGWGARRHGTEEAPELIRKRKLAERLSESGQSARWHTTIHPTFRAAGNADLSKEQALPLVVDVNAKLVESLQPLLGNENILPIVIGGDQAVSVGTWSAVSAAQPEQNFGLIWIDAHMDAHTPQTCHQGKWGGWWHGMPLAALLGHGDATFTQVAGAQKKLSAAQVSLIGVRSFEPAEKELLEREKIAVHFARDVAQKGFRDLFQLALTRARSAAGGYGLAIDMDAFDPIDAPGVGSPEENGLRALEVLNTLHGLAHDPLLKAVEIVEYNPHRDENGKTAKLLEDIIFSLCGVREKEA